MERNLDLVLHDMGVRDEYIRLRSSYLVRKDEQFPGGQVRGGRGGSRDNRGGGGRRSYPGGSRAMSNRHGPVTGTENPDDARVAQVLFKEERQHGTSQDKTSWGDNSDVSIHAYME